MKKLTIVSRVYPPDPAAVGQYLADIGKEMVDRGWQVNVLNADRGYDDPNLKYPRNEVRYGVKVQRLPFSSCGKRSSIFNRIGK